MWRKASNQERPTLACYESERLSRFHSWCSCNLILSNHCRRHRPYAEPISSPVSSRVTSIRTPGSSAPVSHASGSLNPACAANSAWRTRSKVLKSYVMTVAVGQVAAAVVISPSSTTITVFGISRGQRARPRILASLWAPQSNSSVGSADSHMSTPSFS